MKNESTYTLTVPAATEKLADVRKFVFDHSLQEGFSSEQIEDIRLAVDEAFTNIIKHAYEYDSNQEVLVHLHFDSDKLVVKLTDYGSSFDITKYKRPDLKEQIKKKKRGGMGVHLIRTLMDDVSYSRVNKKNEIKMSKNRG